MKKISMNIFVFPLLLMVGIQKLHAQNNVGDLITSPIASPSMASLSRYSDVPINEATGIPNINIPLLSVPMPDNAISYPISLSYNVKNYENAERISDVGYGWSLLGSSVIYKKIIGELDECYDNALRPGYMKNEFDDLYYYSLPGLSGKFSIKRDVSANTFTLVNLSPNNAKIDYQRDSNTATFKADHFTITTDNGYKYYFNEYDYGQYSCSDALGSHSFKTSYLLTKIMSPIGVEVATLRYEIKNDVNNFGYYTYQYCKIKSIKTPKGEVVFDFSYDENLKETVNDPFTVNKISLKNPAGEVFYSYLIDNAIVTHPYDDPLKRKRVLNFIRKNDKNNVKIEQTTFNYQQTADQYGNSRDGILEKMIFPTGGVVQYNYENNEQFFDYANPDYLEYLETGGFDPVIQTKEALLSSPINTQTTQTYNFTIPGDPGKVKGYELAMNLSEFTYPIPQMPDPNDPFHTQLPQPNINPSITFTLKKGTQEILNRQYASDVPQPNLLFTNTPGDYSLVVSSVVDGAKSLGSFQIIGKKFLPGPHRYAIAAEGKRIKDIRYYKSLSDATAEKTINYAYDSFTLPNSTSGYLFYNERDSQDEANSSYILYNSVKIWENGKGHTKKTFKTPNDYPKYKTAGTALEPIYFWPYYNITRGSLPYKEEVYDEQNKLLSSKEINYDFENYSDIEYNLNLPSEKNFSKPAYIKKTSQKEKVFYTSGRTLESQSESLINNLNFKPSYMKSVVDGDIKEKFLTYPLSLSGYAHLESAYMTGLQVITEDKENGKTLSKSKTLFSNASLLPTSVIETNIADGSTKENLKMDLYDDKGNLLQFSNSGGFTTALIYGYNKTSLIAKVEGATYSEVASLAADIISLSDSDHMNAGIEAALLISLDNFRKKTALANYPITTYTYDPLIGITSTTPPSGLREVYEYDLSGKLIKVKRMEKNPGGTITYKTLKEFQYNYKH